MSLLREGRGRRSTALKQPEGYSTAETTAPPWGQKGPVRRIQPTED